MNGNIVFFDSITGDQVREIEGKYDLGLSKHEGDIVTAKKASEEKIFQAICYSADGHFLLAGGNSKFICLYNVKQKLLVARYQISCNLSLEGILEVHDRRRITEWGFSDVHIDMSNKKSLPGVSKDNNMKRKIKIEASVSSIKFAPTGKNFAAATSEGVILFSNEKAFRSIDYVGGCVDFSQFRADVTLESDRTALGTKNFSSALDGALRLKKIDLLTEVIETIPTDDVQFIIKQLSIQEVGIALCRFLSRQLQVSTKVGFYSHWLLWMLVVWGEEIKMKSQDLEWKNVTLDICNSATVIKSKLLSGADVASKKAAWLDAICLKQLQKM